MTQETAIVKAQDIVRQIVSLHDNTKLEMLQENLDGEPMSLWDLDSIKVPAGGGTIWEMPDEEAAKEFQAIVYAAKRCRSFWKQRPEESGGSAPPDCYSLDCVNGIGDPGGLCHKCEHNQWGSAIQSDGSKGKGKQCKEMFRLALGLPGAQYGLPVLLTLPPTSLKAWKQYRAHIPVFYHRCITEFGLRKETSGPNPYAVVELKFIAALEDNEKQLTFADNRKAEWMKILSESADQPSDDAVFEGA